MMMIVMMMMMMKKYCRIKETDFEGKLPNRNGKPTRQSNTEHIL
jgi:hypothetical protein